MIRLCILLLIVFSNKSQAKQLGFYFDVELNSPAVYLQDLHGDWQSNDHGRYAYGKGVMGSWFQASNAWAVGVQRRVYYLLDFTHETAVFYGQLENQQLAAGEYPLSLKINAHSSDSLYLQHTGGITPSLRFQVSAYGHKGRQVQSATLEGEGRVFDSGSHEYQYELDYYYDYNQLFDRDEPDANGYGHSLDFNIYYELNKHTDLFLRAEDVFYRMYWHEINQDQGCVARPTPQGELCVLNTKRLAFTQAMPHQISLGITQRYKSIEFEAEFLEYNRHNALWIKGQLQQAKVAMDVINQAYLVGYEGRLLAISWSFDDFNYHRAHNWQINMGAQWNFH